VSIIGFTSQPESTNFLRCDDIQVSSALAFSHPSSLPEAILQPIVAEIGGIVIEGRPGTN
jgi:hypothetical protein